MADFSEAERDIVLPHQNIPVNPLPFNHGGAINNNMNGWFSPHIDHQAILPKNWTQLLIPSASRPTSLRPVNNRLHLWRLEYPIAKGYASQIKISWEVLKLLSYEILIICRIQIKLTVAWLNEEDFLFLLSTLSIELVKPTAINIEFY